MSTDKDWELWGRDNPYFGVLSDQKYRGDRLTQDASVEFYSSGLGDIMLLMENVKRLNDGKLPAFRRAIDFGCGVGRLTLPLSSYAQHVVGLDVSPSMVQKARENLPAGKKRQVEYVLSDDELSTLPDTYDLVYSNIVFQHIPPARGERIITKLMSGLQTGGFAALHVTYAHRTSAIHKFLIRLRSNIPQVHYALNVLRGRPMRTPLMRMYTYNLSHTYRIFHDTGVKHTIGLLTDHGGYLGVLIIGQKQ